MTCVLGKRNCVCHGQRATLAGFHLGPILLTEGGNNCGRRRCFCPLPSNLALVFDPYKSANCPPEWERIWVERTVTRDQNTPCLSASGFGPK